MSRPLPEGVRRTAAGGFQVRWYDASGGRDAATFDTAADADAYRQEELRARRHGGAADPSGAKMLLRDWFETWMAGRTVRDSTLARDARYAQGHILPTIGDLRLADIRPSTVAQLRSSLLARGSLQARRDSTSPSCRAA